MLTHTYTHTHIHTHTHTHTNTHTHTHTYSAMYNNSTVRTRGQADASDATELHWSFLLHLEVLVHPVEPLVGDNKYSAIDLQGSVELENKCRVVGDAVAVHG